MIELINQAKELIKMNKIKKIGGPGTMGQLYEVGEHTVRIYPKPGRLLFECGCYNGTKFCNESPFCVHKTAVILFEGDNDFNSKAEKMIFDYQKYKNLKLKVSPDLVLDDLNKLKRAK